MVAFFGNDVLGGIIPAYHHLQPLANPISVPAFNLRIQDAGLKTQQ
jgi:hypothetical protein